MMRKLMGTLAVAVVLCASVVLADEIKGKVVKIDADDNKITISVDGKEHEYMVAADAKFPKGGKNKDKEGSLKSMSKNLDRMKDKGGEMKIIATTEKKDGKETITEIKMQPREKN
jgi:hypothetical protein